MQTHCTGQEDMTTLSSVQSQELSNRIMIFEKLARSELGVMERDARFAFFYQDQQLKFAVRECQRQTRHAIDQAVR